MHKTQNFQKTPYIICRGRVEQHCSHNGEEKELLIPLQLLQLLTGFKEERYTGQA